MFLFLFLAWIQKLSAAFASLKWGRVYSSITASVDVHGKPFQRIVNPCVCVSVRFVSTFTWPFMFLNDSLPQYEFKWPCLPCTVQSLQWSRLLVGRQSREFGWNRGYFCIQSESFLFSAAARLMSHPVCLLAVGNVSLLLYCLPLSS